MEVFKSFDLLLDYDEAVNFVIDYVEENKHILNCAYDSMGRDELRRFLYNDFSGIVMNIVNKVEEVEGIKVSENKY